jgi:ribonucleoside-diphosphate reductase alpha chain
MRKILPDRRRSWTQKAKIGGLTCYATFGEYEDGTLGEVFLDVSKFGTFARGALDAFAKCFSIALQCGAELQCLVSAVKESNFPPNDAQYSSVIDWVASEIQANYLPNARRAESDATGSDKAA